MTYNIEATSSHRGFVLPATIIVLIALAGIAIASMEFITAELTIQTNFSSQLSDSNKLENRHLEIERMLVAMQQKDYDATLNSTTTLVNTDGNLTTHITKLNCNNSPETLLKLCSVPTPTQSQTFFHLETISTHTPNRGNKLATLVTFASPLITDSLILSTDGLAIEIPRLHEDLSPSPFYHPRLLWNTH